MGRRQPPSRLGSIERPRWIFSRLPIDLYRYESIRLPRSFILGVQNPFPSFLDAVPSRGSGSNNEQSRQSFWLPIWTWREGFVLNLTWATFVMFAMTLERILRYFSLGVCSWDTRKKSVQQRLVFLWTLSFVVRLTGCKPSLSVTAESKGPFFYHPRYLFPALSLQCMSPWLFFSSIKKEAVYFLFSFIPMKKGWEELQPAAWSSTNKE